MKPLVVNIVELLRSPGTKRRLDVEVSPLELGIDDPRVEVGIELPVRLELESLSDGIVVTGTVSAPWRDECRRCLAPVADTAAVEIDEVYRTEPDGESFPLSGDQVDLAPMVRELVVLHLPAAPLCRDDCAGICPSCGADRNISPCDCVTVATDDRWAALDALRDQLN